VLGLSLWIVTAADQVPMSAVWLQSAIIAATYATSIVFGVMLRRGLSPRQVARPMQAADIAVTSLLVYATGGAESPYIFLYALSVVGAGALSYRTGAVAVTIASIGSLICVSLLAWGQVIALPALSSTPGSRRSTRATPGINLAALMASVRCVHLGDQPQRGVQTPAIPQGRGRAVYAAHEDIVRSLSRPDHDRPDGIV
jgi:hypothetical protein